MKKLALALVCLVSVAFFASCKPEPVANPEPAIAIITGENYLYDGEVIDLNVNYLIGFRVASNAQTQKELAKFSVIVNPGTEYQSTMIDTTISGKEFVFQDTISYGPSKVIVGESTIKATVTDVDGKTNSVTIKVEINQPAVNLVVEDINWVKTGHNAQDLSAYGLFWEKTNYKTPFTHILPADSCTLFLVENAEEDFAKIVTDFDLANKFQQLFENSKPIDDYDKIDCNASGDYKHMLITKEANGKLHAIYISRAEITTPSGLGTRITITGKAK